MSKCGESYTLAVVGAGSGGLGAARIAAKLGVKVVLIEKNKIGGDCTWTGCVPSKALIKAAKMAHHARSGRDYGVDVFDVRVDMKRVKQYVAKVVEEVYTHENKEETEKKGIEVILGAAKLIDKTTIRITPSDGGSPYTITTKATILSTGSSVNFPNFVTTLMQESGTDGILTYDNLFDVETLPGTLAVLGGGPIGCEIAQAYSRLGCKVTIVARTIMPKEDKDASHVVRTAFEREGITHISGRASGLQRTAEGRLVVSVGGADVHEQHTSLQVDAVLVATGRTPNSSNLGLERLGVTIDKQSSGIVVNSKLQTTVPTIYAVGDCTGNSLTPQVNPANDADVWWRLVLKIQLMKDARACEVHKGRWALASGTRHQFTHYAGYQGSVAALSAVLPVGLNGTPAQVPRVTFTDPEVAHVGSTEEEHLQAFKGSGMGGVLCWETGKMERAVCEHESLGFIKLMYHKKTTKLHGATVVCSRAGEIMQELAVAISQGVTLNKLANVMHAYPSFSFTLQEMAADVYVDSLQTGCAGCLLRTFIKK